MGPAWLVVRADLRRRWRPMLAMALLIGLVSGVVLVSAAGARRTDTAYPRFLSRSHAADLLVSPARSGFHGYFRAVAGLPQVAAADTVAFLQMSLPGPGASPYSGLVAEASPSGGEGTAMNRVKVLAGRSFDPADPHAVMISQVLAGRAHLRPGGTLHLIGYPQRGGGPDMGRAVRLAFRVSAIVCGRVAWRLFAGQLGIQPVVTLPVILVLVVPAALVLAVAAAAVPGESAARTRPAEILRSE